MSNYYSKPCQCAECYGKAYLIKCLWSKGKNLYRCSKCFESFETPMLGTIGGDGS